MASLMQKPFLNKPCDCGVGKLVEPKNGQEWHLICSDCSKIVFCYVPMPHQERFHRDTTKFRMYAGGYGSAKTSTCAAEMVRHVLETPNGTSLIGAQTYAQLEETAKKTFMEMLPQEYVGSYEKQKNKLNLINGHTILFRSFDEQGKLRSLNLTAVWIEEASEVDYEIFVQLQTRLRNHATKNHFIVLSTNPDLGWIKTEFLLKSAKIEGATEKYFLHEEDKNPNYSTHIAATHLNTHLPTTYYDDIAKGKSSWWIARYLDGSFSHSSGMVFPMFEKMIVEPFTIPKNWERVGGADFGIRDYTVLLLAAIDPDTGTVYVYDEYYQNTHAVSYHAKNMLEKLDDIPRGALRYIAADPSGKRRSMTDHSSLFDHYAEYGIYFKEGNNRIESGLSKIYTWFILGKLKIFGSCRNLVKEGLNYKYKEEELGKKVDEKPIDKDNHAVDSLRYLVSDLPDDPSALIQKSYNPREFNHAQKQEHLPFALQDTEEEYHSEWMNY